MGLSFAVPIDLAMNVVEQIKNGHVSRGWLGVLIQDVTRDLAETFGMPHPRGALVAQVLPNSPADQAQLRVGDVILSYNDHDLPTSAVLPPLVGTSQINRPARLRILRDGKELDVEVTIGELPDDDGTPQLGATPQWPSSDRLGLTVRDITPNERKELKLGPNEGAIVDKVPPGAAKDAGLRVGDVILRFDTAEIQGAKDLRERIEAVSPGRSVAILVQREDGRMFMALRVPE
jgi:serine protease Do